MMTFLFDKIIFGPVSSRRLGVSLGINLLPTTYKYCSFNCIYCECGLNPTHYSEKVKFPTVQLVKEKLDDKLKEMQKNNQLPDTITFAGNGEPTLHPDFAEIIDITIELRNKYSPKSKIAVLSNSTMLHNKPVMEALKKIELNILKLDTGFDDTLKKLNQPTTSVTIQKMVDNLKQFKNNLIIQTLFLKGLVNGEQVDNTTDAEVNKWVSYLKELKPQLVMIYPIARETPVIGLEKISQQKLDEIAQKVRAAGIETEVYY
ncbi:MAG TPA: radical SAM protein [Bacteroidales bacterium]|nr:radical SAM protein [Bacteroidales bacterium]HQI45850.1 radical SAM protein [Bacteroidales bacterium]